MESLTKEQKIDEWSIRKKQLNNNFEDNPVFFKELTINKGDIYLCEVGENIAEEQCRTRPVIILSKTFYNNVSSQVTVAPLSTTIKTKTKKGKVVPATKTHFILYKDSFPFLDEDSCIKCEQIRSISKARLIHKIGNVSDETLHKLNVRLKDLFDI